MGRREKRRCLSCAEEFVPDASNARHQRYCCGPVCRAASKRASQAKWLAKPENRDYHRGEAAMARGRAWRAAHPGYKRRKRDEEAAPETKREVLAMPLPGAEQERSPPTHVMFQQ